MARFDFHQLLVVVLTVACAGLAAPCAAAAQQGRTGSGRIVAFDDDAPVRKPAAEPVAPAPEPERARPDVAFGAVVPPPPRVIVAPRGTRPGGVPEFSARPAAATRLAVNSPYGVRSDPLTGIARMHTGVDLHARYGESVGAAMSGTVWFAGARAGYGNLVVVDHGDGVSTFYAHLSSIAVRSGDVLEAGQLLGYVGSTGRSTGPHLHYEVRANGHPVDPSSAIAIENGELHVNGQALGQAGSWRGPVELPRAPGGTSIAVDWGVDDSSQSVAGQTLAVDWE